MLEKIIHYSINHKLVVFLFTALLIGFGIFSLTQIPLGPVPDITSNQVQVITTSQNLATEDVEKYLTYPVELEMANLPGVIEIRSISKFGLSVVTVVFEDKMGTYLPRQLIAEKIKLAEERIPAAFGKPFMGPVSTGLGEIYQYIIDVEDGFEDRYSIMELRTIQDWIVKRQLSGIEGVVEVNTWGGFLKQYEVAINPERLRAVNVDLADIYQALQSNNDIAGGGYIEKTHESYFVRGEGLVESLEDIENIVIETRNGNPVYIRDVATVGFGHANRFGAITANGEGEKVLGQIMMLKDADSKATIDRVKERLEEMKASLPEGIIINGFLDRSELIDKTTHTIAENLILGCLIVVFVVVLLLGNFRSGLVVASVIPLSLLFALSMMYLFGVDANLMSLGAIDFGIIIDGAVIIVEYIAFKITAEGNRLLPLSKRERRDAMDEITYNGATKMMRSAVFGQIIIIIVFIPILSLSGVEGKMFIPMAQVFSFALIGTMILGFTYVPVVSSLFLKPEDPEKKNVSTRLIAWLNSIYEPCIVWALKSKKLVLGGALLVLCIAGLILSRMGGEFVPTLDEGDFVIQPVLKTGTTLTNTIQTTTQMEKILLDFPEVKQVVTRIGAAEIPTDPMSMEESDVIITLKPKNEWTTASTKDELADHFKEALSVLPGIDFEFTQPIEMRFNELITGVRADLAIKIFGEDLNILHQKAQEIERAIRHVQGASDIIVEKVDGLPQMTVRYDRQKIAKHGLNVSDLNQLISMGFAGLPAGTVFEGEKQFDLVIRYEEDFRKDIENLEMASIKTANGSFLPLSEFANISYTKGPAKISRDNTRRRIVIGVNVRNSDLQTVVNEIQNIVDHQIDLPSGYTIDYGGQFENLNRAKARLTIAVPVALILIFVLLYFAFHSVKESLIIYSAIPFAAVGGILLLYLRGMPFSISAGVGFIALFGIAVLNGIVLIEHFKELKAQGMTDLRERIIRGTKERLRPVLLTASAAALGFLPMAISNSAGAEVQRPLATVVVGGLMTATILTLVVLPVLYAIVERDNKGPFPPPKPLLALLFIALPLVSFGQDKTINLEQAIEIGLSNNASAKASALRIDEALALKKSSWDIDKTEIFYRYDQNEIAENGYPNKVWGIRQSFQFPTVYGAQQQVAEAKVQIQEQQHLLTERMLAKEISKAYYEVVYWKAVKEQYRYLDSLYGQLAQAANRRYQLGESNYLEKLTSESQQKQLALSLAQTEENIKAAYQQLYAWLQTDEPLLIRDEVFLPISFDTFDSASHPGIAYYEAALQLGQKSFQLEKQKLFPEINIEFFRGSNVFPDAKIYHGVQAGVAIPLWFGAQASRINASKLQSEILEQESANYRKHLANAANQLRATINKQLKALNYYHEEGQALAAELISHASLAFRSGEIDFLQLVQLLENATTIELAYLEDLRVYNNVALDYKHLMINE
ncbi:MAG TPA: CusA/CzcA family heavy metal efflux RND transporter [Cyclobacteriaceae bacterium]|nr:CusA/CzcA family heavy metal efflux RND transporter [Cyclobacteriaceae bacterium]